MGIDTYTVRHWNEATNVHELSLLTAEQDFIFDTLGFVVLPQVFSQAELSACRYSSEQEGRQRGKQESCYGICQEENHTDERKEKKLKKH